MIKSFPSTPMFNPGGLASFHFIPFSAIYEIGPVSNGTMSGPVVLKAGMSWHKGYATQESLSYSEKAKKTDHGTSYVPELSGRYPGDAPEAQELFAEMETLGNEFLVVFRDQLGRKRLAGYAGALEFSADYDSDSKRYSYSFRGESLEKAPIYPF